MKILFAAGGTGGHINPALAVANRIRTQYGKNAEILFVGTENHIEARLVPAAGFAFKSITISGFYRGNFIHNFNRNIKTVKNIVTSSSESRKIIEDFAPDVVVGFGGYVSGPVLRTAHKMGVPIALHEQNAFPGVTNKALAKVADLVMLTSEDAEKRMSCKTKPIITGLPVRDELLDAHKDFARAELGVPDNKFLILSMGGSLGADSINKAVCGLIANKQKDKDCIFIHATGQFGTWVPEKLKELSVDLKSKDLDIREYIDDMQRCMPAADLVICRAGASSLYEIRALGKASILVPSPNVAENHQYYNAMELVTRGAAVMIEEKDLTSEKLTDTVNSLIDDKIRLAQIEHNVKAMAITNATDLIVSNILSLI